MPVYFTVSFAEVAATPAPAPASLVFALTYTLVAFVADLRQFSSGVVVSLGSERTVAEAIVGEFIVATQQLIGVFVRLIEPFKKIEVAAIEA